MRLNYLRSYMYSVRLAQIISAVSGCTISVQEPNLWTIHNAHLLARIQRVSAQFPDKLKVHLLCITYASAVVLNDTLIQFSLFCDSSYEKKRNRANVAFKTTDKIFQTLFEEFQNDFRKDTSF